MTDKELTTQLAEEQLHAAFIRMLAIAYDRGDNDNKLSKAVGMSRSTISKYKNRERRIGFSVLCQIAKGLGVDINITIKDNYAS